MEVDEIQRQVSKFQRVSSNGSTTSTDTSSNPQKIATDRASFELQNHGTGGGVARLCGWPSSRIVRVSRASGGKDRHSKVLTSKGLRDRRVRLSVSTAIQFYDLQDRLGYDQPSKAVEWLLKAAASSIDELPSLDPPFPAAYSGHQYDDRRTENKLAGNGNDLAASQAISKSSKSKSPACSSTSETSRGSGLSLSRSENRMKARERAREMASKKEKEKEIDSTRVTVLNQVHTLSENSSFTDLLSGGINTTATTTTATGIGSRSPMDYFYTRSPQIQIPPQFNISTTGDNNNHNHNHHYHHHPHQHYSFIQDSYVPAVTTTAGGGTGESYNLNFAMTSSTTGDGAMNAPGGFSRGTLQSNLQSLLPHHHHQQHLQRFQSSSIDVSTSSNLPFFIVPNTAVDHYPVSGGYQLNYGGGRSADHHKDKSKN